MQKFTKCSLRPPLPPAGLSLPTTCQVRAAFGGAGPEDRLCEDLVLQPPCLLCPQEQALSAFCPKNHPVDVGGRGWPGMVTMPPSASRFRIPLLKAGWQPLCPP